MAGSIGRYITVTATAADARPMFVVACRRPEVGVPTPSGGVNPFIPSPSIPESILRLRSRRVTNTLLT